jgi:VIT1/CCC1 family predicted Fe2+/Mn2+ transporter
MGRVKCAPVAESRDAFAQVAAGLVLGVDDSLDVYLGQGAREQLAEVLDEGIVSAKGGFIPLVQSAVRLRKPTLSCSGTLKP